MSITWNGVSSDTIGVIVERIPDRYVPARRFSPQQVAGRNGDILLVDKSFPNVEQEYEVYLSAEAQGLPSVARACAEWLMGPDGYCRLEDSYDTTVYREAFLMGGYDLENILNKFGRCTITFSCKPKKYLLTGDTPIEIDSGITTYTGDVVQFDGITGASITSLSTTITPTQDLHGYTNPWPAGGGVNKYDMANWPVSTTRRFWGTDIASVVTALNSLAEGTYTITAKIKIDALTDTIGNRTYGFLCTGVSVNGQKTIATPAVGTVVSVSKTFTLSSAQVGNFTNCYWYAGTSSSTSDTVTISEIGINVGSDATYYPYSNICPISGLTGLSVYRTGKNLLDFENKSLPFNGNRPYTVLDFGEDKTFPALTLTFFMDGAQYSSRTAAICDYQKNDGTHQYRLSTSFGLDSANVNTGAFSKNETNITFRKLVVYLGTNYGAYTAGTCSMQLELGSSIAYEPYNGNTYAVDWSAQAGTVYGGTVDVVTGVLTVDRANIPSYNGETITDPWLSSMDAYAAGTTPTIGAQVVYTLATPLTYQLAPQEIGVLTGENSVWLSDGDVSLTVLTNTSGIVTNPTPFEARPLLEVSGVGEITINGKSIQILESVSDFRIDCEAMEAEDNSKIYCMDFPELSGGGNEIVCYGSITDLTVTPRWWTL